MEKKIKLRPKQLNAITEIQAKKQQITNLFQELNEKEGLLLNLIFEASDIDVAVVTNIKLDGEFISYEEKIVSNETQLKKKKVKSKDENIS